MKKVLSLILIGILLVNTFAFTASLADATTAREGFFPGWDTRYRLEKDLPAVPLTFTAEVQFPIEYNYAATDADGNRTPGKGGAFIGNYTGQAGSLSFQASKGYPRFAWNDYYKEISKQDNRNMIFYFDDISTGEYVTYQGKQYPVMPLYTGKPVVVTITVDQTNKKVCCYLDGVLKQTITYANADAYDNYGNELEIDASYIHGSKDFSKSKYVIAGDNSLLNNNYLRGLSDNQVSFNKLALFSTVRSATQVKADYEAIANDTQPSGAFIYFDFAGYPDKPEKIADVTGTYVAPRKVRYVSKRADINDYLYSMAFIGDTQKITRYSANYDGDNPSKVDNLQYIYKWLLENKEAEKIEYVIGLGDITDISNKAEWAIAVPHINSLSSKYGNNYIAIQGNHDRRGSYTTSPYDYSFDSSVHVAYDDAFKGTAYEKSIPTAQRQNSKSILNFYKKVNISGVPYMFVCLEYAAPDAILNWASDVIAANPNYNVIYVTHAYLSKTGVPLTWDSGTSPDDHDSNTNDGNDWGDKDNVNNGEEQWHRLVKKHKNICMVVSGHIGNDEIMVTSRTGDNGNVVKQVLIDHQDIDGNLISSTNLTDNPRGLGVVSMMYFMGDGKTVRTDAISTLRWYSDDYSGKPYFDESNRFSFELELNGTKGGDFSSTTVGKPDGYCTVADVLYVIDEVLNDKGYKCDTNGDGVVTLADILRVISYINK